MDLTVWIILLFSCAVQSQYPAVLETCGKSDVVPNGDRIVGGRDAITNEYPWQVSLIFKRFFLPPAHLCGASILNERWLITAAHCVFRRSARNFIVAVGIKSQEERNFISYSVDKIKVHELFDPETFLHDVAVIRVSKPISLSSGVNGICLPPLEQNVTGYATTTGWGAVREDGGMSSILQTVDVPLMPSNECQQILGPEHFFTSSMLCAGDPVGGIDACEGDSGGPLIQQQNDSSVLIGIVSWGIGCARPNLPGVYARVSHYINWIVINTT